MSELKPLRGLSKTLICMLWIYTFILGCAIIGDLYWWIEYTNVPPDAEFSEVLMPSDIINGILALVQGAFYIGLAVIFLKWIHRANKNLGILSGARMEFTPGWSVGWYFIPIACLFKPYQAMKEIWIAAHREWGVTSTLLGWWWFLWLTSGIVGGIAGRVMTGAETVDAYTGAVIAYLISDGYDIILNVVALMVVSRISNAYEAHYGSYHEQGAAAPGIPVSDAPPSDIQKNLAGG